MSGSLRCAYRSSTGLRPKMPLWTFAPRAHLSNPVSGGDEIVDSTKYPPLSVSRPGPAPTCRGNLPSQGMV